MGQEVWIQLYAVDSLHDRSVENLDADQLPLLGEHSWRGTIAALVYRELRSPLAHGRPGAPAGLFFSNTVHRGEPVDRVSFETVYAALWKLGEVWKEQFINDVPCPGHDDE